MSGVIAGNSPVVSALKSKMTTMKQRIEDLETDIHKKNEELKDEILKKEKVTSEILSIEQFVHGYVFIYFLPILHLQKVLMQVY